MHAHILPFSELRVLLAVRQFYKKGGAAGGGEKPMPDFGGVEQAGGAAAGPKVEEVD